MCEIDGVYNFLNNCFHFIILNFNRNKRFLFIVLRLYIYKILKFKTLLIILIIYKYHLI